ncbi:hypothetical protein OB920_20430 [Halobacteria archaeon HArc-gm2]|nr:hypothetical protein [Halobacteria archaeon HArc-gm2]
MTVEVLTLQFDAGQSEVGGILDELLDRGVESDIYRSADWRHRKLSS